MFSAIAGDVVNKKTALIAADPVEGIVIESGSYGSESMGQLSICKSRVAKVYIANVCLNDVNNIKHYVWTDISTSLNIDKKQLGNYYAGYKLSAETDATLTLPTSNYIYRVWVKFIVDNSNAGSLLWGDKVLLNETETGRYLFEFLHFMDFGRTKS